MTSTNEILDEFDTHSGKYKDYTSQIESLLSRLVEESQIQSHSITSRVKTRLSLEGKCNKRQSPFDSLRKVTDISGIRITTYFADDVDKIAELIRAEFEIDEENSIDKRETLDPDKFGYLSLHYIASLNESRKNLREYSNFDGMCFEVQIRSLLQHAWAEVEHDLGYKSTQAVPRELQRQFARLAGLLELADEQFVRIRDSSELYRQDVGKRIEAEPASVTLNLDSLSHYITTNSIVREIDEEVVSRIGFKSLDSETTVSELLTQFLGYHSIETIETLDSLMRSHKDGILNFAEWRGELFSKEGLGDTVKTLTFPSGGSVNALCILLAGKNANETQARKFLDKFGIGEESKRQAYAEKLVEINNE